MPDATPVARKRFSLVGLVKRVVWLTCMSLGAIILWIGIYTLCTVPSRYISWGPFFLIMTSSLLIVALGNRRKLSGWKARVRSTLRRILVVGVVAYAALSAVLMYGEIQLTFPAPRTPLRAPLPDEARAGYTMESLQTSDGVKLNFWVAMPDPGKPMLVMFHGNGDNATQLAPDMAPLRHTGYGLLLAEFRGYSGNPGVPSEDTLDLDARAYAAWAQAHVPGLPVVGGESIGTGVAVRLASEVPVRGVILDSPFTSLAGVVWESPIWWAPTFLLHNRMDSLSRMPHVTAPVLIVHGMDDRIVSVKLSYQLAPVVPCLKDAVFLPHIDHLAIRSDHSGRVADAMLHFMKDLPADGSCTVPPA